MSDSNSLPIDVDVQQVDQMRKNNQDFLLLDIREEDERQTASIDGTLFLPMSQLGDRIEELDKHRDEHIVVHCHHGGRSLQVTEALRERGYPRVQNMAGGIDQWSQQIDSSVPRY